MLLDKKLPEPFFVTTRKDPAGFTIPGHYECEVGFIHVPETQVISDYNVGTCVPVDVLRPFIERRSE